MTQHRAYSVLEIRAVDDDARIIEGMASTPTPDRVGDIVEPEGAEFKLPLPLLWQHDHRSPVGHVEFAKPSKAGIPFRARLAKIAEAGPLKEMIDTAWQAVKAQLVRGVSIGFRAKEYAFIEGTGGIRFTDWEWLELSLVTVPANREATISAIKSISAEQLAASGRPASTPPGASGKHKPIDLRPKEATEMKTLAEQIAALEAKRVANTSRMEEVMQKSIDEGRSSDESEQEEFDGLESEVKAIDADLRRLRALEAAKAVKAAPIKAPTEKAGTEARVPAQVKMPQKVDPGIRFTRFLRAKYWSTRENVGLKEMVEGLYPSDDVLNDFVQKAAIGSLTTTNSGLVPSIEGVVGDFVEWLMPQTIVGKFGTNGIPNLRRIGFRQEWVTQLSEASASWVREGAAKPVTKPTFGRESMLPLKVAAIIVGTDEMFRDSRPSAEPILRDALGDAIRKRIDLDFIDPANSGTTGAKPASITNGITPIAASGTGDADDIREDVRAVFSAFIAANNPPTSGVWIMPSTVALAASLLNNTLGTPEFAGITMNGGTFFGLPVIASEFVPTVTAGSYVILVNAQDIFFADEGDIQVSVSSEASILMDTAPNMTSDSPTAASLVSMFQTNSRAIRAERSLDWMRRRDEGVRVLSAVNWNGS